MLTWIILTEPGWGVITHAAMPARPNAQGVLTGSPITTAQTTTLYTSQQQTCLLCWRGESSSSNRVIHVCLLCGPVVRGLLKQRCYFCVDFSCCSPSFASITQLCPVCVGLSAGWSVLWMSWVWTWALGESPQPICFTLIHGYSWTWVSRPKLPGTMLQWDMRKIILPGSVSFSSRIAVTIINSVRVCCLLSDLGTQPCYNWDCLSFCLFSTEGLVVSERGYPQRQHICF